MDPQLQTCLFLKTPQRDTYDDLNWQPGQSLPTKSVFLHDSSAMGTRCFCTAVKSWLKAVSGLSHDKDNIDPSSQNGKSSGDEGLSSASGAD